MKFDSRKEIQLTQKQIYDAVCELAYAADKTPEDFISHLFQANSDSLSTLTEGLDDATRSKLEQGEKFRREAYDLKKKSSFEQAMREDINKFRSIFTDVSADDIPESVWNEAAEGIPLCHAYALYLKIRESGDSIATQANEYAASRSVPVGNDESEAPYTMTQVEAMTPKAIKSNYKKILDSIKGWKL